MFRRSLLCFHGWGQEQQQVVQLRPWGADNPSHWLCRRIAPRAVLCSAVLWRDTAPHIHPTFSHCL